MQQESKNILLFSESADEIKHLREVLSEKGWVLEDAEDIDPELVFENIDLVLVDLVRDDGRGLDIIGELQASVTRERIPVVVISGLADKVLLMQALDLGVTDFIWRGASSLDVQARVSTALKVSALQKRVDQMSCVDEMTGTHTKTHMMDIMEREFERSRRYKRPISCLLIDLDAFEELEQTYSVEQSCDVLKLLSDVLTETFRNVDEVSRFRKSIFLVLLPETSPTDGLIGLGRVRERLKQAQEGVAEIMGRSQQGGASWRLSLTAGIATYPDDGLNSYADLIMAAETALYEAKRKGRGETVSADFQ